jgi:hypothetical protein
LAWNWDKASEWSDMSTPGLVSVNWHYKNPTKHVDPVQNKHHLDIIISSNVTCSHRNIAEKVTIWHLATISYF